MRFPNRTTLAIALTASFSAACAKSEPAAPVASDAATTTVTASDVTTAADSVAPQAAPGSPIATFTPSSETVAPMLPMLGASPIQPPQDEHSQSPEKAAVRRIAPEEAAMLVQTGEAILVDVRSKEAWDTEHIKCAKHIPYAEIESRASAELTPKRWIIPYCT